MFQKYFCYILIIFLQLIQLIPIYSCWNISFSNNAKNTCIYKHNYYSA